MDKDNSIRTCIVCRKRLKKEELIRLVNTKNDIQMDLKQTLDGRGCYVCKNKICTNLLIKKRQLNKAFKTQIKTETYNELNKYIVKEFGDDIVE